jgi:hypothetical protein
LFTISQKLQTLVNQETNLSVASFSFSMEFNSSVLVAADKLVSGVLTELPPLTDPVGVVVVVDVVDDASCVEPFCFAACLAAFSANRFCLDADCGGILPGKGYNEI